MFKDNLDILFIIFLLMGMTQKYILNLFSFVEFKYKLLNINSVEVKFIYT